MATAELYTEFAWAQARGESACYLAWAQGVAADRELLGLLAELPEPKRQPNLLFAAARYTGIAAGPFADFRAAVRASWPGVRSVMMMRRTQTNEAARCAPLLPLLAALPPPLALLEVGGSDGGSLHRPAPPGRRGPERQDRGRGRSAPDDATLVIFHTSVLGYLDAAGRSAFTAKVRDLPGHWISNEIPAAVAFGSLPPLPDPTRLMSVLAQDGRPVAYAGTNGQDLHWFA